MATTATPISSANIPFHMRLKPPLSPSFVPKCTNPLNINGISVTKSSKLSKNGGELKNQLLNRDGIRVVVNGLDKATQSSEETINKNKEKLESVKAALISAIVGTLASFPISLTHFTNTHELTVSTAITVITCALYGATYRYTIRKDFDDFHLKTGTSAAFGIVKGVATLDGKPYLDAFSGVVCVSENVFIFIFAAAGLDICYKMGIIHPFPLETSVSKTKL